MDVPRSQPRGARRRRKVAKSASSNEYMLDEVAGGDFRGVLNYIVATDAKISLACASSSLYTLARCKQNEGGSATDELGFHLLRCRISAILNHFPGGILDDPDASDWPRHLSTIAWSHAALQLHDGRGEDTMQLLCSCAGRYLDSFQPIELCNLMWAVATYGSRPSVDFLEVVARMTSAQSHSFSLAGLSTMVWSFAKICPRREDGFFELLFNSYSDSLYQHDFDVNPNPADFARLLWGVAKAGTRSDCLKAGPVVHLAQQMLYSFRAHDLSVVCWSISRLAIVDDEFFKCACSYLRESDELRMQLNGSGFSNMLWSFAQQVKMGSGVQGMLKATPVVLSPILSDLLPSCRLADLGLLLLSIAQLGVRSGYNANMDDLFVRVTQLNLDYSSCFSDLMAAFELFCTGLDTEAARISFRFLQMMREWHGRSSAMAAPPRPPPGLEPCDVEGGSNGIDGFPSTAWNNSTGFPDEAPHARHAGRAPSACQGFQSARGGKDQSEFGYMQHAGNDAYDVQPRGSLEEANVFPPPRYESASRDYTLQRARHPDASEQQSWQEQPHSEMPLLSRQQHQQQQWQQNQAPSNPAHPYQHENPMSVWNSNGLATPVENISISDFLNNVASTSETAYTVYEPDLDKLAAPRCARRRRNLLRRPTKNATDQISSLDSLPQQSSDCGARSPAATTEGCLSSTQFHSSVTSAGFSSHCPSNFTSFSVHSQDDLPGHRFSINSSDELPGQPRFEDNSALASAAQPPTGYIPQFERSSSHNVENKVSFDSEFVHGQ
eukprot:TRINITY_DN54264_c0_g1_i1.p1 TRINITY_DN54264_c0_g1~~TRINITY_DN54264_c0_g1_i1.p1  ORF type:complete len:779 (-),score=103.30 TRINITY_DN54264_c0_g1_i1:402-2738(-)